MGKVRGIEDKDKKEEAMKKWFDEDLPAHVAKAEKSIVIANPSPAGEWLIGKSVSYADIAWFQFLAAPNGFFDNAEGAKAAFQKCPRIKAALEATAKIPELVDYLAKRKETMM